MSFASIDFFIFVFFAACTYFLVSSKYRWIVLLIASYAFYLISSPKTIMLVICTTLTTWFCGIKMEDYDKQSKQEIKELKENNKGEDLGEQIKAIKASAKKEKEENYIYNFNFKFWHISNIKIF